MRGFGRVAGVVGAALVLAVAVMLVWALWIPAPMPQALAALASDERVIYSEFGDGYTFQPAGEATKCGLFFYPGGRVDARAYAPALRAIAEQGYLVATKSMPLNLAILSVDAAGDVQAELPAIERWAVGGHSLGGSVATFFAHDHPDAAQGVALWAAYATAGRSLANRDDLTVVSVSASNDGLATPEKVNAARVYLPAAATFIEIAGGNHAQFGWYGDQRGDNPATIRREEQQAQTVAATVAMLNAMCGG